MGMLIEGHWRDDELAEFKSDGQQVRSSSGFHAVVSSEAGAAYAAAAGRYALYCNRTCPWSHRAVATRALKGLDDCIGLVLLEPAMSRQSWWFGERGVYRDPALGVTYLHELYSASDPDFTGRLAGRLRPSVGLHPRSLPVARYRRNAGHRRHEGRLLRHGETR